VLRTGGFEFEAASGVCTELPCGSSIFMDADYGKNRDRDGEPTKALSRASLSGRAAAVVTMNYLLLSLPNVYSRRAETAQRESSGEPYYRVANPSSCYAAVFAGRADTG
jgi:hypothetical protein